MRFNLILLALMFVSSTAYSQIRCNTRGQLSTMRVVSVQVPVYYGVGSGLQFQSLYGKQAQSSQFLEFLEAYRAFQDTDPKPPRPASLTMIAQKCGKCHGSSLEEPKKGLYLDTSIGIEASDITKALRLISTNKMPPGNPLTNEEKSQVMEELLNSERKK